MRSDDVLAASLFDRFQRLIRNTSYRYFCDSYEEFFDTKDKCNEFIKDVLNHPTPYLYPEFEKDLAEITERFGLQKTLHHYRAKLTKEDMLALPIFKESQAVEFLWNDEVLDDSPDQEDGDEVTLVHDGHYISARINISPEISLEAIVDEIKKGVETARSSVGYTKMQRARLEENLVAYEAYDRYLKKKPYVIIAIELGLKSRQNAIDKVIRAFELIGNKQHLSDEELAKEGRWDEIAPEKHLSERYLYHSEKTGETNSLTQWEQGRNGRELIQAAIDFCTRCLHGNIQCKSTMLPALKEKDSEIITACSELRDFLQSLMEAPQ